MLELGGALAVDGDRGPIVVPHEVLHPPEGDHRLDREGHAGAHDRVRPAVVVVQDLQVGVELLADAVADERAHDAVAQLAGVRLDRRTDVGHRATRTHGLDAEPQALARGLHQPT